MIGRGVAFYCKAPLNVTLAIFPESATRPINSISCNVRGFVWLFVLSAGTWNRVDWTLLVKGRIAKMAKLRTPFIGEFVPHLFSFAMNSEKPLFIPGNQD